MPLSGSAGSLCNRLISALSTKLLDESGEVDEDYTGIINVFCLIIFPNS